MTNEFIHSTHEKKLAIIEIDNAPANALSTDVIKELSSTLKEVNRNEEVHAVILTGKGRFFVAGADIKEFIPKMENKEAGFKMSESGQSVCGEIELMKKLLLQPLMV